MTGSLFLTVALVVAVVVVVIGLKSALSGSAYEHLHGGLWTDGDNDTSPLEMRAARSPHGHGIEPPAPEQPPQESTAEPGTRRS
jgi:hypothetical protein